MDSSYGEMKKRAWQHGSGNVWLQSCPSVYLLSACRHVLITGLNCETPGTIVTQVIKFWINLMWAWIPQCSSWHYRRIQCNSATVLGVSDCTSVTKRLENSVSCIIV
jgi:hypothetical protein